MSNSLRTGLLMVALTGSFLATGFLAGGQVGMSVAFLFVAGNHPPTEERIAELRTMAAEMGQAPKPGPWS